MNTGLADLSSSNNGSARNKFRQDRVDHRLCYAVTNDEVNRVTVAENADRAAICKFITGNNAIERNIVVHWLCDMAAETRNIEFEPV